MCRSRREPSNLLFEQIAYSNDYVLDEIGVDTAENEPLEVWGKIIQYYSFVSLVTRETGERPERRLYRGFGGGFAVGSSLGDPLRLLLDISLPGAGCPTLVVPDNSEPFAV